MADYELPVFAGGQPEGFEDELPDYGEVFGNFEPKVWNSSEIFDHDVNLAQFMDDSKRHRLAQNVIEWVARDRSSRSAWEQREKEGIKKLGLTKEDVDKTKELDPSVEWRSQATHPGLIKACIQFWARANTELFPPGGPAKAIVLGASTDELQAQALRVANFLNYLYTQDIPGALDEASMALFRLPLSGSVFKKIYFDPVLGTIAIRFLESQDFVKPYSAVDLGAAVRYTHIVRMSRNDLNKAIAKGYYRNIEKGDPNEESESHRALDHEIDRATGVSPVDDSGDHDVEHSARDVCYEMSVILDLSNYGLDDPLNEQGAVVQTEDGRGFERISVGLPYLVTVHEEEQKILAIRRDWRETDDKQRRRRNVVEMKFLPGFGGYGFGLLHIASGLSDAQTGNMRYLLDGNTLDVSGQFSGWASQAAVGAKGLPPYMPGKIQTVPGSTADLRNAVVRPEFQWRTNNTLETLQYLDGLLDFLVAATQSMVGDPNQNVPVGTTLARIEQQSKPFASIFKQLHTALGLELKAIAETAFDSLPDRWYPYAVEGEDRGVFPEDFDDRVDVVPVSDPNIVSSLHRMARAEVLMEKAKEMYSLNPSVETWISYLVAYRHMLEIMRVPNPEEFLPQLPEPQVGGDQETSDETRKDAETAAKIDRANAESAAKIERENEMARAKAERDRLAEGMAVDSALRTRGSNALIAREADREAANTAARIVQMANARQQQMAQGAV